MIYKQLGIMPRLRSARCWLGLGSLGLVTSVKAIKVGVGLHKNNLD